jgi:DNA-binding response OmpR family regulator
MTSGMQRESILLVDDDLDIRKFAKIFLETAGYAVITAADGEQALRLYEENQSSIVLIVTDVLMPNINGFELADRVLRIDSQMPILFMSGEPSSGYRGLEYLVKPLRPTDLVKGVRRVLNAHAHSKGAATGA